MIDHAAQAGSGTRDVGTLHRVDEARRRLGNQSRRFRIGRIGDLLRNPNDTHTLAVFDPAIRGKTDCFVLKFRKPLASGISVRAERRHDAEARHRRWIAAYRRRHRLQVLADAETRLRRPSQIRRRCAVRPSARSLGSSATAARTRGSACRLPRRRSGICAGRRHAPPQPWSDVRDALTIGNMCVQYPSLLSGGGPISAIQRAGRQRRLPVSERLGAAVSRRLTCPPATRRVR